MNRRSFLLKTAAAGLTGYEPIINFPEELTGLGARLKAHGLEVRFLCVNSSLHDLAAVSASIDGVLVIARRAIGLGIGVIVTNPSPIRRGGYPRTIQPEFHEKSILCQNSAVYSLGLFPGGALDSRRRVPCGRHGQ